MKLAIILAPVIALSGVAQAQENRIEYEYRFKHPHTGGPGTGGGRPSSNPVQRDQQQRANEEAGQRAARDRDYEQLREYQQRSDTAKSDMAKEAAESLKAGAELKRFNVPNSSASRAPVDENYTQRWAGEKSNVGVIDSTNFPTFRSSDLQRQRDVVQNLLQAVPKMRPNYMGTKPREWMRAAVYLTAAAREAEAKGNLTQASELLSQARAIAGYLSGHSDGRSIALKGDDAGNFELTITQDTLTSMTYDSANPDAISQAGMNAYVNQIQPGGSVSLNPNKEFASIEETSLLLSHLPSNNIYANNARDLIDASKTSRDAWIAHLAKATAVVAVDVAIGFVPPLAFARDGYEVITGRHWLTGEKLTTLERGLALVGVLTVGTSSAFSHIAADASKAVIAEREVAEAMTIAREAKIAFEESRAANPKFAREALEIVRESKDPIRQKEILLDVEKSLHQRMKNLGMGMKVDGVSKADNLNRALVEAGGQPAHKAGTLVFEGRLTTEVDLSRVFAEGKTRMNGDWLTHNAFIDGKTSEQIGKEILNMKITPDKLANAHMPVGTRVRVSEVGKNAFGTGEGAIQVEILDKADASWFKSLGGL